MRNQRCPSVEWDSNRKPQSSPLQSTALPSELSKGQSLATTLQHLVCLEGAGGRSRKTPCTTVRAGEPARRTARPGKVCGEYKECEFRLRHTKEARCARSTDEARERNRERRGKRHENPRNRAREAAQKPTMAPQSLRITRAVSRCRRDARHAVT